LPRKRRVRVSRIGPTGSITGWVQDLPLAGLALVVFAVTFLAAAAVYALVMSVAHGKRGEAFKAFSPGMLPPMGLLFALIVGFLAAQVWSDAGHAQDAVNREAGALRSVVLVALRSPVSRRPGCAPSFVVTSGRPSTRSGRPCPTGGRPSP
jgi:hypothetical protein